ncbi:MAG: hypothetical protein EU981_04085 [Candidatus Liberibacter ctenarytainae]|uniref:Uncharacterized protein n=1 Tax=Candidatus Liberibacter ctenarytainae TaxID=2020335 RepID=A0A937DJA7_9HYPH|nr:hypothetical protein [Candidatus Liberibacter ctenarytainae]
MFSIKRFKRAWRGEESLSYTFWFFTAIDMIFTGACFCILFSMHDYITMPAMNIATAITIIVLGLATDICTGYTTGIYLFIANKFYHDTVWAKVILGIAICRIVYMFVLAAFSSVYAIDMIVVCISTGVVAYRRMIYLNK